MSTTVETIANTLPSLTLRGDKPAEEQSEKKSHEQTVEEYKYAHLLPVFVNQHYAPLEPFEYSDPGLRALQHPNPHSFLDNATGVAQLTPHLGSEITGVKLTSLDSNGRDQLALEVSYRSIDVQGLSFKPSAGGSSRSCCLP
jgi:sulfonate dioxygenase